MTNYKSKLGGVLIVDDQPLILMTIQSHMERLGYSRVRIASNGEEGLKLLAKENFDLIICDIQMPVMNGIAFFEQVRKNVEYAKTPFVLMSITYKDLPIAGNELYFIKKPFLQQDLMEVLADVNAAELIKRPA